MGKGFFDVENKIWQFLNKITDIVLLGLLTFVFSIPVITAGAALCGFYYGTMALSDDTDAGIWSDFIRGFRTSFGKGTAIWFIQLAATAILLYNLWVSLHLKSGLAAVLMAASLVCLAMVIMVSFFAYPIAARYAFGLKKTLLDAVNIMLRFLPHGLALLVIAVLGVLAAKYVPYITILIPPIVGYQIARVNVWVFQKLDQSADSKDGDES